MLAASPVEARTQEAQKGQVDEQDAGGYHYLDEGDIRQALEDTLSQPDFVRLRSEPQEKKEPSESETPGWLTRFFRWLSGLGGKKGDNGSSTSDLALPTAAMRLLLFSMAVLILAAAIVFIAKAALTTVKDRKIAEEAAARDRIFQPGAAPGEIPPEEYWRRALAHGEGKRYREAIRDLLLGAMSVTERRGLIRFRRGLTNRDYFYSVRGSERDSFGRIAAAFEYIYFGRRAATSDAFRECCREYEKSFGEAST